jgi:hypothetical protein
MRLRASLALALALAAIAALPPAAGADFGFKPPEISFTDAKGNPIIQAGSKPFTNTTIFEPNTIPDPDAPGFIIPDEGFKDLILDLPRGLVGSPNPVPPCSSADFLNVKSNQNACPRSAIVGLIEIAAGTSAVEEGKDPYEATAVGKVPVYNLIPPPGVAAKLGFTFVPGLDITIEVGVNPTPPYNLQAHVTNIAQAALFYGSRTTIWGIPASPAHDAERGQAVSLPELPLLIMPRSCEGPLSATFTGRSWDNPGRWVSATAQTAQGMSGCERLEFGPRISNAPSTDQASSPSGLQFNLDIEDEGLMSAGGIADSDIAKAQVTLPEGVTVNPSQAEGLATCSEADLEAETASSDFGAGCPAASKIGTVEVETPLVEDELFKGQVFVATPYENRFGTLIAIYMTIKSPKLGVGFRLAGKVEPDPETGQLITSFEDLPEYPFSHFRFHFREGARSPLITPPLCGTYTTTATFTPSANPQAPYTTTASFEISKGPGGGPCPPPGAPPFEPQMNAGTLSNEAGSYSPFHLRLRRRDGDQDLTRFSFDLPPGLVGSLAGTTRCPDSQIAIAKAKSGTEELASPSCPRSSEVGDVLAGAGAGSQLTYVPGKAYLAGPYHGAPLSAVGIVPAVAGPFDVGTVVTRQALKVHPRTAKVSVDGAASDPIPHILAGIPLAVRDIRVHADRPKFTLNPTSCDPFQVKAELWGGGADPFSSADDSPVQRATPFQAAGCDGLGFRPSLSLELKGGTRRGDHPSLRAVLRPRPGDANISKAVVTLPQSAFLDQAHIRTICTRVQFAADNCPKGSLYGQVRAFTPLLDEPVEGPLYLRSSNHNLPDLVFDLHGLVRFEAVGRIDSKHGGIRSTFTEVPDAPISKVVLSMQGARKGLIVNSTNLCLEPRRATALFSAHNGRQLRARPLLRAAGCSGKAAKRSQRQGR